MVKWKNICLRVKIVNKRTDHLSPLEDSHLAHLSTLYQVETEASTVKQLCKQTKPPPKQRQTDVKNQRSAEKCHQNPKML